MGVDSIASDPGKIIIRHQIEHPSPGSQQTVYFPKNIFTFYFFSNLNYFSNEIVIQSLNNRGITLVNGHNKIEEVEVFCYD